MPEVVGQRERVVHACVLMCMCELVRRPRRELRSASLRQNVRVGGSSQKSDRWFSIRGKVRVV